MAIKVPKGSMHIHRLSSKGTITKANGCRLILDCDLGAEGGWGIFRYLPQIAAKINLCLRFYIIMCRGRVCLEHSVFVKGTSSTVGSHWPASDWWVCNTLEGTVDFPLSIKTYIILSMISMSSIISIRNSISSVVKIKYNIPFVNFHRNIKTVFLRIGAAFSFIAAKKCMERDFGIPCWSPFSALKNFLTVKIECSSDNTVSISSDSTGLRNGWELQTLSLPALILLSHGGPCRERCGREKSCTHPQGTL